MGIEQQPQRKEVADSDFGTFTSLQMKLLNTNHPDWDEPTGKVMASHADDMKRLGDEFRDYVETHPEVLKDFESNPEEIVNKLKEEFYH